MTKTQSLGEEDKDLDRIRQFARKEPEASFNNLLHHLTISRLYKAYYSIKRNAASGVDGETWSNYQERLEERLKDLYERIQSGRYKPQPSRRVWCRAPL